MEFYLCVRWGRGVGLLRNRIQGQLRYKMGNVTHSIVDLIPITDVGWRRILGAVTHVIDRRSSESLMMTHPRGLSLLWCTKRPVKWATIPSGGLRSLRLSSFLW